MPYIPKLKPYTIIAPSGRKVCVVLADKAFYDTFKKVTFVYKNFNSSVDYFLPDGWIAIPSEEIIDGKGLDENSIFECMCVGGKENINKLL